MRAWTHNLPIIHVSCVAHVDSRRRHYVEFTLRVPDEYRVTVAAEDRWKNFGREFRCTRARTRVIAREIGLRWASFNPKTGRWEWISHSFRRENSLREIVTFSRHFTCTCIFCVYHVTACSEEEKNDTFQHFLILSPLFRRSLICIRIKNRILCMYNFMHSIILKTRILLEKFIKLHQKHVLIKFIFQKQVYCRFLLSTRCYCVWCDCVLRMSQS